LQVEFFRSGCISRVASHALTAWADCEITVGMNYHNARFWLRQVAGVFWVAVEVLLRVQSR